MRFEADKVAVDRSNCFIVDVNPRNVGGVPILKGTRGQADSIVEKNECGSPVDEIAENFGGPEGTIRELLKFAAAQQNHTGS